MKFNFKTYLKHTYKGELVYLAVIVALYLYDHDNIIFLVFSLSRLYRVIIVININ